MLKQVQHDVKGATNRTKLNVLLVFAHRKYLLFYIRYAQPDKLLLYLVYFFPILNIELTGKSKKVNISFG